MILMGWAYYPKAGPCGWGVNRYSLVADRVVGVFPQPIYSERVAGSHTLLSLNPKLIISNF